MDYHKFEKLSLLVGAVAILGPVFASYGGEPVAEEVVAQILLLGVLVGAVHWGRRGGFVASLAAVLAYLVMRLPITYQLGFTPEILQMVLVRSTAYGFVGIMGGEFCGRLKYLFARMEDSLNIDEETRVYNERYFARLLKSAIGQHLRYGTPFSLVLVTVTPALLSDLRPQKRRTLLRTVANHMRNDLRLVDEVGHLEDGRFALLLPQTPAQGAVVAGERLRSGTRDLLGARDESVTAQMLSVPDDLSGIEQFQRGLVAEVA